MAEGSRMWAISLLTIMLLLPLLSAAPLDFAGDIKKMDVMDDNDGMHSHDENVTRRGKFFGHNRFDIRNINISGSVAGDVVSVGHQVKIDVHGHTLDHPHHEADPVIECKEGLRVLFKSIDSNKNGLMDAEELLRVCHQNNIQITESSAVRILTLPDKTVGFNLSKFCELLKDCQSTNSADIIHFLLQLYDKGSFDECQFKTCGELCQTGVCDGHGFCVDPLENPCEQHGCEGKSCGDPCLAGDIVGNCDIDGNCDFDIDRAFNSCDKQEAPKQEGESCGSCLCPPTYSAGDCAEGLTCERDERIPDAPGICTRPGGREEPEEKKVVIPCGFNDDILAPRFLPNGQKSPRDTSHVFQWKNNIVPYYFSNDDYRNERQKAEDREFVRGVMDKFEEKTCFEFVEKSKNQLRMEKIRNKLEVNEHVLEINIQDYPCTWGNEGVVFPVAGTTRLQLYLATHVTGKYPDGSKCRNEGLVIHELMHAFGVGHTHRRRDRDTFIQVILDNLNANVYNQYDICEKCVLHKEIPYECGSIMHYGSHDNTEDFDKAVIVPLDKEKCKLPRKSLQVYDASAMDWQLINIIGECPKLNGQASPDVQSSPENYPEKLANVDRILRGYDIMRGNPQPLKEVLLDPGLRLPIFEATYHEDSKTPDHRYLQPDGVDILNCIGGCVNIFKTDQFSGAKSYQQSLSNEVGFSLGGSSGAWGGKFSASLGFRKVSEKTSSESKIFTMSSATCCAYRAALSYNHPSLSKDFLQALKDLTEKYDEKIYLRFIVTYGTHFISSATMGSKFIHLKEISKETVSTLHQNGVDIKAAAEVSAYAVTGSVDTSSTSDNSMADSFSSEADTQYTYTIGVKSPEDGKASTWLQKPIINPAPIKLELTEIVDLLDLHKDLKVSAAVKDNLKKAMNDYCGVFQKDERVSTCSAPGPDPPIASSGSCEVHVGRSTSNTISALVSEGCVCPTRVHKGNWLGDTYPDEFEVTQDGSSLQVRRTDSNTGWAMDLSFMCFRGSCEVHVGKSTEKTISAIVSEGCVCPTLVNKRNWLGDDNTPDEFKVTQDGSSLQVRRIDSNTGWAMDLSFKCFRGSCEVHVGRSTSNTISAIVSEGCVCPTRVHKGNWLGGDTYQDEFEVTQDGSSLQVRRIDSNPDLSIDSNIGWAMDLSFKCFRGYRETSVINLEALSSSGEWGKVERCSYPYFVNKMELKYERKKLIDNTALNAIRLTCANGHPISSTEGEWGSYYTVNPIDPLVILFGVQKFPHSATCPHGQYINAAKIRSEAEIHRDNTAANGIRFKCTDGSKEYKPEDGDWGDWGSWKKCEDGSAIYGIQTLVQPHIDGDDTALNNVKFLCAKLPNRG